MDSGRLRRKLKRINVIVDCDDVEAEKLAPRIPSYLLSLGALNVSVVRIDELIQPPSNK
jgi:hypothetical protein